MARIERSAGFVIYRHSVAGPEHFLLLNYGRHWDFAKGHVEAGESDLAAAHRELEEESGITQIRVVPGFQRDVRYFFRGRGKQLIEKTVVFFLAETQTVQIVLSEEHVGSAWLSYETAIKRLTYPTAREVLREAHLKLHPAPDDEPRTTSGPTV